MAQCKAIVVDINLLKDEILNFCNTVINDRGLPVTFCSFKKNVIGINNNSFFNEFDKYLRIQGNDASEDPIKLTDDIIFDIEKKVIVRFEEVISLSNIEYRILLKLAEKCNEICSSEDLIDFAWGYDEIIGTDSLYVHIHNLREKIEDVPKKPKIIKTKRGIGYVLLSNSNTKKYRKEDKLIGS
ncbi:winged helix-turn-helix domain-containing protein [Priestia megaterium]|uniref:winged helix-turn-helix domain-containing protein n=1 Tax=Priestia megaterium TaxID=1404 RepID=UPI00234F9E79|nr:winged helix-turn-helix domain-containing protein [Priestia megaterium]MDC7784000.1 winged helix-turn-helix domain-containing protein [Priestia megaterium]